MAVLIKEQWQHLSNSNDWSARPANRVNREVSSLQHSNWSRFNDPSGIVFHGYSTLHGQQESFVRGLFDLMSERGHDGMLEFSWAHNLARFYTPLRFAFHGLKMMSGRLMIDAPAEAINNCAAFQVGDYIRWMDHTAYRTAELNQTFHDIGFGKNERRLWESDLAWQSIRELIEQAMSLKDWDELFCVLNLVIKPAIEEGIMTALADVAGRANDTVLPMLTNSQLADARRHKDWARCLVELALEVPGNREILAGWLQRWMPLADNAMESYCLALPDGEIMINRARLFIGGFHSSIGIA